MTDYLGGDVHWPADTLRRAAPGASRPDRRGAVPGGHLASRHDPAMTANTRPLPDSDPIALLRVAVHLPPVPAAAALAERMAGDDRPVVRGRPGQQRR